MRERFHRRCCGALMIALLLPPHVALAWTEAQVESAQVRIRLDSSADAQVQVTLPLRVRGGWLQGLEIAGLDPDMELDADGLRFLDETGRRRRPRVTLRDEGTVRLSFTRREAPRRGRYRVELTYRTHLAERGTVPTEEGDVRVAWTLPGWRAGLDGVAVEVEAPQGARFFEGSETGALVERHRDDEGSHTRLRWRRAHLPRTVPWTVTWVVPGEAMDPALSRDAVSEADATSPGEVSPGDVTREVHRPWLPLALALALALACLGGMVEHERRAHRQGVRGRPLIALPMPLRVVVVLVACSVGACATSARVWLASLCIAALMSLERAAHEQVAPRLGLWMDVDDAHVRRALRALRRDRWLCLFDASSPLSLAILLGLTFALSRVHHHDVMHGAAFSTAFQGWLILLVPFLSGCRAQLPASAASRLLRLWGMRHVGDARLALHVSADGRWQDVRLRLRTESRPPGLLRLDIAIARGAPRGIVVVRAGTEADSLARSWLSGEPPRSGPGARIGWLVSQEEVEAFARELDGAAPTGEEATLVDEDCSASFVVEETRVA